MLENTIENFYVAGIAFSLRLVIAMTALLCNLISMYMFTRTKENGLLAIIGFCIFIDNINVIYDFKERNSTRTLVINDILSAIQGSLLSTFVSIRFSKMLISYKKKLAIFGQPLGFIGILLMALATDKFVDEIIGFVSFGLFFFPIYILNLYSCFLVIFSIRSSAYQRDKLARLLVISNCLTAVYAIGPILLAILAIQPATDPMNNVVVATIYLLMSISDLLMMGNKCCAEQTIMWLTSQCIK